MKLFIKKFNYTKYKKIFFGLLYFLEFIIILYSKIIINKIVQSNYINIKYIEILSYYNSFLTSSKYFIFFDFIIFFIPSKYHFKNINTIFFIIYDIIINYKNIIEIYNNLYLLNSTSFILFLTIFIFLKANYQICALLNIVNSICINIFIKKETKLNKIFDIEYDTEYDIEKGLEY